MKLSKQETGNLIYSRQENANNTLPENGMLLGMRTYYTPKWLSHHYANSIYNNTRFRIRNICYTIISYNASAQY